MEYWASLLNCRLFQDMEYMEIEEFLNFTGVTEKVLEKGDILWLDKMANENIIVTIKGKLKINSVTGQTNSDSMVENIRPGNMFGTAFSVLGIPAPGHMQALARTIILLIPVAPFLQDDGKNCPSYGKINRNLIQALAEKVHEGALRLHYLRFRTLKKMLSAYLLDNAQPDVTKPFTLPLNKSMLADMLGVSRPAMVRVLSAMQGEGLISYRLNSYHILKPDALEAILNDLPTIDKTENP